MWLAVWLALASRVHSSFMKSVVFFSRNGVRFTCITLPSSCEEEARPGESESARSISRAERCAQFLSLPLSLTFSASR